MAEGQRKAVTANLRAAVLVGMAIMVGSLEQASGWPRVPYEDAEFVERAELIVVGRLERESIQFILHRPTHEPGGQWWEHSAMLVIDQILKGRCETKTIPILIHYGLTPVAGGRWEHEGGMIDLKRWHGINYPKENVTIVDTGNSIRKFTLGVDAAQNNLWFLRRLGGELGRVPDPRSDLGILDPEDVQPLGLKDYFLCYLSKDPESAVREQLQHSPETASRANRYLIVCELRRVAAIADAVLRVERALPYWTEKIHWKVTSDASKILVGAGKVAGPYLMSVYQDRPDRRQDVISLWGQIRYDGCIDTLTDLLKTDDRFWKDQRLEKNWWNSDINAELNKVRRVRYCEDHEAVMALGKIGDPRAQEAVQVTRSRWTEIDFDNPQIIEACNAALRSFQARRDSLMPVR